MGAGFKGGSRDHGLGSTEQAKAGLRRFTGTTEPTGWTPDATT
jgi:hypothetical protein